MLKRAVLNILVRNASPIGSMCFTCLVLYCLLDLSCVECNVISLYLLCGLLIDLFVLCVACLTVFVTKFGDTISNILGVVVNLLLNVMEVLCVGGDALLDRPCMVIKIKCVLCL